jgi:uncharacterized protein with von Willebrand factor type A (vWA) domain
LLRALVAFAAVLRQMGMPVSMVEMLDASRATALVNVRERSQLRRALALTLVKRAEELSMFEGAFDLCFPAEPGSGATGREAPRPSTLGDDDQAGGQGQLLDELVGALRAGSDVWFDYLAAQVVAAFGGLPDGEALRAERYYSQRVLRQLDLSMLLRRAMLADNDGRGDEGTGNGTGRQLAAMQRSSRLEGLKEAISADLRRRWAERAGLDQALANLRGAALDVDFLRAGGLELDQMRQLVRPLARRMAVLARQRRRRSRAGRLDVRRTVRLSLSQGGVALNPVWHRRLPRRPELVVLCDVSGSVAEFAKFSLSLLQALQQELPRARSFVFVDSPEEVTDLVRASPGVIDPRLFLSRPGAVRDDGHSDYGATLSRLLEDQARCIGPQTTLIFCGDGRTNHRPSRPELLGVLSRRVRHIYWLNPEPRELWGTGDSAVPAYAPHCDEVAEVRNLRQLSAWVQKMLVP